MNTCPPDTISPRLPDGGTGTYRLLCPQEQDSRETKELPRERYLWHFSFISASVWPFPLKSMEDPTLALPCRTISPTPHSVRLISP